MADKKGIFRSPGNIVFNAQSISERADQLRVADDSIIVNYDRTGTTATLQFSQTTANASISWNGTALTTSVHSGVLNVVDAGGDGSLAYSGNTLTYTGPSAAEVRAHLSAGAGLTYDSGTGEFRITNTAVTTGTYGTSNDVAQITINSKGQITSASDVAIDHDALANFVANEHIDHSGVTLTAGTGLTGGGDITASRSFALTNTGVSATNYGAAGTIPTFTVDAQGRLTTAANVAVSIVHTQVTDFDAGVRAAVTGTAGEIDYNSSNGQFGLASTVSSATNFSTELTAPTVASSDNSTKVATTAWVTSNAPGTLTNVQAGGGIVTTWKWYYRCWHSTVDSTVVRTTGAQVLQVKKRSK